MITLVLQLALVGVIVYLVLNYVPMPQPIKTLILVVVVIFVILYLMRVFGIGDIPVWHYPRR